MTMAHAFELGCGDGLAGGAPHVDDSIGDIYDAIATMHAETVNQIKNQFGVAMTAAEEDWLASGFHRLQEVAKSDWKYQAVGDIHQIAIAILNRYYGGAGNVPKDQADALNQNMIRIDTNLSNYGGGVFSDAANWARGQLPVVLGVLGGVAGGLLTVATFGAGAASVPLLIGAGVAAGTAAGAAAGSGANSLIDKATAGPGASSSAASTSPSMPTVYGKTYPSTANVLGVMMMPSGWSAVGVAAKDRFVGGVLAQISEGDLLAAKSATLDKASGIVAFDLPNGRIVQTLLSSLLKVFPSVVDHFKIPTGISLFSRATALRTVSSSSGARSVALGLANPVVTSALSVHTPSAMTPGQKKVAVVAGVGTLGVVGLLAWRWLM